MRLLSEPTLASPVDCPYLDDLVFMQEYFFACDLDEYEMGVLLNSGWRRFGKFFFRPRCPGCRRCIPIRIDAARLQPTRSQRRIIKRGEVVDMEVVEPHASDEVWRVYRDHSEAQFDRDVDREEFERSFFDRAAPMVQTEYRVRGDLVAVGFLDRSSEGMSSIYFSFDPAWARLSLGTLSVFWETELVKTLGLRWYYLGYWVKGCPTMDYKARFGPHQLFDWNVQLWLPSNGREEAP